MDQNKDKVFVGEDKLEKQKREMKLRALLSDKLKNLQEHVKGLRALLSSKQENLTIVKDATDNAISIIESKREEEKTDVDSETVLKLQNELKTLKESTDTYSNAIVLFQNRIDELNGQIAAIKPHCPSAEAEGGVADKSRG